MAKVDDRRSSWRQLTARDIAAVESVGLSSLGPNQTPIHSASEPRPQHFCCSSITIQVIGLVPSPFAACIPSVHAAVASSRHPSTFSFTPYKITLGIHTLGRRPGRRLSFSYLHTRPFPDPGPPQNAVNSLASPSCPLHISGSPDSARQAPSSSSHVLSLGSIRFGIFRLTHPHILVPPSCSWSVTWRIRDALDFAASRHTSRLH